MGDKRKNWEDFEFMASVNDYHRAVMPSTKFYGGKVPHTLCYRFTRQGIPTADEFIRRRESEKLRREKQLVEKTRREAGLDD